MRRHLQSSEGEFTGTLTGVDWQNPHPFMLLTTPGRFIQLTEVNNDWRLVHTDELRIIERIRRPSLNYLEYQFTAEDPKVLAASWTSAWRTFTLGQEDLFEKYCTNNQTPGQFQKLYDQETNRNR